MKASTNPATTKGTTMISMFDEGTYVADIYDVVYDAAFAAANVARAHGRFGRSGIDGAAMAAAQEAGYTFAEFKAIGVDVVGFAIADAAERRRLAASLSGLTA